MLLEKQELEKTNPNLDLGKMGVYEVRQKTLHRKSSGRKIESRKDSKTRIVQSFPLFQHGVQDSQLRVGDVLVLDSYRHGHSYLVHVGQDKKVFLEPNKDTSGSGYLTIPLSVSKYFKNAVHSFGSVEDVYTIELSPRDEYLKQVLFGNQTVPRTFEYEWRVPTHELQVHDPKTKKYLYLTLDELQPIPDIAKYLKTQFLELKKKQTRFEFGIKYEKYDKNLQQRLHDLAREYFFVVMELGSSRYHSSYSFSGPAARKKELQQRLRNEFPQSSIYQQQG